MRVQLSSERGERGAAAIIIALLTVVLFSFVAFVTDFGMAYSHQRALQNGVDAAALAAAQEVLENSAGDDTCEEMIVGAPNAEPIAQTIFEQNTVAPADSTGQVALTCNDSVLAGQVVVSASGEQASPAIFGGIMGFGDIDLTTSAKAVVGPAASVVGVRPFAICEAVADFRRTAPDTVVTLDFSNADLGCGTASGNFGTLDMTNSGGTPGTAEVRGWITDGFGQALPATSPLTLEGRTGTPSVSYQDAFAAILDDKIVLPVYDVRTGPGSNAIYRISGFVGVKVCAVKLGPSTLNRGTCAQDNAITLDGSKRFLQLRFVEFIVIGNLDTTCPLHASCDPGVRVVKLAQ